MTESETHTGVSRLAKMNAVAALLLIGVGGLVTSHEAGLAVPDWPTTYGYNMFTFPPSLWQGGIFYEHVHRLVASGVGLLTLLVAGGLWWKEQRVWLRWLGAIAVLTVVLQGVLGGLRVTERLSELGIVHAALAQLFLVLASAIAWFTSRSWAGLGRRPELSAHSSGLLRGYVTLTALVFLQLMVAATMRHQHAGLAVPDFPAAYGRVWPDVSAEAVARYNQMRTEFMAVRDITAFQIVLHMIHRVLAVLILAGVGRAAWRTWRRLGLQHPLTCGCLAWLSLVAIQISLGAATVWTWQSPLVRTAHVIVGATTLVSGSLVALLAGRLAFEAGRLADSPVASATLPHQAPAAVASHL
jgi:heme a synthase